MKHIAYPKIGQFRNVIQTLNREITFVGLDDKGEPIYDPSIKKPLLTCKGTVKIHGCFDKNTLITLANGEQIPISDVKAGMSILSYDITNNIETIKKIKETFIFESDKNWIELVFSDRTIKCTEDHKFYTKNRGWVEAKMLNENDEFIII